MALIASQRNFQHVYPVKDFRQICQHCNPLCVLHMLHRCGVNFGEEEEDFLAKITQAGEDLALRQPADLVVIALAPSVHILQQLQSV